MAYDFRDLNGKAARYWRDVGTLDAYYAANMDLVVVTPEFNLYDQRWPIRTTRCSSRRPSSSSRRKAAAWASRSIPSFRAGCVISGGA